MRYAFLAFLTLLLATFYNRINHYDEPWLAEQAYWLVRDGRVRSELFRGLNGWETQLFVYHKAFIWISAGWQRLLGFSLVAGKSFSLVWAVGLGTLLWGYLRQTLRQHGLDSAFIWLGLLLFVANGILIEYSFVYRPEVMCATLGFASFWLLTNHRWAWAGTLAGLAALTHLNGLCYVLAGAGWLLWRRQPYRPVIGYSLLATAGASLYLLDVALATNWSMFWMQWENDPALWHINGLSDKLKATFYVAKFWRIAGEMGLLFGGTYWLTRSVCAVSDKFVGRYLLLFTVSYLVLSRTNAVHYAVLFLPFCCVWVTLRVAHWQAAQVAQRSRWLWSGLLATYLLLGVYRGGLLIRNNLTRPGIEAQNAHLAALIGQTGSKVMAPLSFFYGQIDTYRILAYDWYLPDFFNSNKVHRLTDQQLFAIAERDGFVAVVTYDGKGPNAPLTDTRPLNDSLARFGSFKRVYQNRWNSLYTKCKEVSAVRRVGKR